MNFLKRKSEEKAKLAALDPATLLLIVQAISQLVQCYIDRNKAKDQLRKPGFVLKALARTAAIRQVGPRKSKAYADAALEMAQGLTEEELDTALEELGR